MNETIQMLNAVIEAVDAAILMVDMNFRVVLCNKKFGEFFGLDSKALIGDDKRAAITRDIKWRVKSPEDFQRRLFWLYDNPEVVANDEVEVSLPLRRVLHRFSGPVYDEQQRMLGRVEVYTDITEAKTLHEEFELKNAHLFLLNAAATAINDAMELGRLCRVFLQRLKQVTEAQAGILYIREGQSMQLKATTGTIYNLRAFPKTISEPLPHHSLCWGPGCKGNSLQSLAEAMKGSFSIVFPAVNQEEVIGLCVLIWENNIPKPWLNDNGLFDSVGIQLGIGIHNALLHGGANVAAEVREDSAEVLLSPREREVLGRLAAGMSNKEIATSLGISEYTVKNHVRNILGKMCVRTRGQAVAKAASLGLL